MSCVYVLSGREELEYCEWETAYEVYNRGVYDNFEKAIEAFKNMVIEASRELASIYNDFEYTEETLFESCENEDTYGWQCSINEDYSEWFLQLPENGEYDLGFWFVPNIILEKFEIK